MKEAEPKMPTGMIQLLSKIIKRLRTHEKKTVPVIEKYEQLYGVVKVDGNGTFEEIFDRVTEKVEYVMKHTR